MALSLTGCASYQARLLPEDFMSGSGSKTPFDLQCSFQKQHDAGLHEHAVNPADGLDFTEMAIIAVLNNLDPQISANLDMPTGNTNGAVNAWGLAMTLLP